MPNFLLSLLPMLHKFDWSGNNVLVTFKGNISFHDIASVDGMIFGDSRFDEMDYSIYDFSEVSSFKISESELKLGASIKMSTATWKKRRKLACIASSPELITNVNNFIKLMSYTEWDIKHFNDLSSAVYWVTDDI